MRYPGRWLPPGVGCPCTVPAEIVILVFALRSGHQKVQHHDSITRFERSESVVGRRMYVDTVCTTDY